MLKKRNMDDNTALDFTEQLLIFRDFGMIYERPEFVQANKVRLLHCQVFKTLKYEFSLLICFYAYFSCLASS